MFSCEIRKIIFELYPRPPLTWSSVDSQLSFTLLYKGKFSAAETFYGGTGSDIIHGLADEIINIFNCVLKFKMLLIAN